MPRWLTEGPSVDTITCPVVLYAPARRRVVGVSAPPQPVQGCGPTDVTPLSVIVGKPAAASWVGWIYGLAFSRAPHTADG
ncbi:unnamed protein product [Nippostrongylus brasiliensis]|uniref:Uncharacterized protein n=1 Tax=Nippostrongylus brasiliensis TaxID=27835 RepID=A0A0N4XXP7_NIPBR|nr:unnamed protein product [Nippostrongylus brasiliensis]